MRSGAGLTAENGSSPALELLHVVQPGVKSCRNENVNDVVVKVRDKKTHPDPSASEVFIFIFLLRENRSGTGGRITRSCCEWIPYEKPRHSPAPC